MGITNVDPNSLKTCLPKYACPDLVNKSGFWCKALGDYNLTTNTIFHYYVSSKGDVHVGVNGGDLGIFISGIDTRQLYTKIVHNETEAIMKSHYAKVDISKTLKNIPKLRVYIQNCKV